MFNKFVTYCLKTVISPHLVFNKSRPFLPLYTFFKFLNLNVYRKSLYLHKRQISAISTRNVFVKKRFVFPSLLTLYFGIPFFGSESTYSDENFKIVMILKKAILERRCGEVANAEELLNLALKSAQETNNIEAIVFIYDLMTSYALEDEDYVKVETHLRNILELFLKNGKKEDDNDVVKVSLYLAIIQSYLGNNEIALQVFHCCIRFQEKKMKSMGEENIDKATFELCAMIHDWFAKYLYNVAQYDQAIEHFKRAYEFYSKVKEQHDPIMGIILNDIGYVYDLQNNYDEAIHYFKKAINLALLCEWKDLASYYITLGIAHMQKNALEEAEWSFKTAMRIAKRENDEETVNKSIAFLEALKPLKI